jgi:hypothetical protein
LALGYLLGKISARVLKTDVVVPAIFTLSVISDIDFLLPLIEHRGPTHSIIVAIIIFAPILATHRRKAVPYLAAFIHHPLLGDYMTGRGVQLFWPITMGYYGIAIEDRLEICLEWFLFATLVIVMLKTKDVATLLQPKNSNIILTIPSFTVLLPSLLEFPLKVPSSLILPHAICLALFLVSLLEILCFFGKNWLGKQSSENSQYMRY